MHEYRNIEEARASVGLWIKEYNHNRPHQGVQNRTPHEAFLAWEVIQLSEAQMSKSEGYSYNLIKVYLTDCGPAGPKPENETEGKLNPARWTCFSGRGRRRRYAEEGS
jgi:hypothetical protein